MKSKVLVSAIAIVAATSVHAEVADVTIGVLRDMSGVFAGEAGDAGVTAVELAVEDFQRAHPEATFNISVVSGDHQNKPDVGATLARKWFESDGVDVVVDLPNSGVALAVANIARELNKAVLITGAGSTQITQEQCSPNTVHWTWDTYATAQGAIRASADAGRDKWFFITADYSFGKNLEENATNALTELGFSKVGSAATALGTTDFSSIILQAQSSGANMIGFANAGGDFSNAAKQALEFGLPAQGIGLTALWDGISGLHTIGLEGGQGLSFVVPFYWDESDQGRDVNARLQERHANAILNEELAGNYGATYAYLEAVLQADTTDGDAVVAAMKTLEINDLFGEGYIRGDGRKMHSMKLYTAKDVSESLGEWDLMKLVNVIPADEAFAPMLPECNFSN